LLRIGNWAINEFGIARGLRVVCALRGDAWLLRSSDSHVAGGGAFRRQSH
jgi:hypothetical protein